MKRFFNDVIRVYLSKFRARFVCEIGAGQGLFTRLLLRLPFLHVTVIDPCAKWDLEKEHAGNPRARVRKGISLEMLQDCGEREFDAIMIDGDHNWYTVYHELALIHRRKLLKPHGVIFLHDTAWPYGRRDMYYAPERIPQDFRHPYQRTGMVRGQSRLAENGMNGHHYNAIHEGGPRNGVLTAVEDFQKEAGHPFWQVLCPYQYGLCALISKRGPRSFLRYCAAWWLMRALPKIKILAGRQPFTLQEEDEAVLNVRAADFSKK